MDAFRTENDSIGKKQIPENAFYGIHSLRAKENFPGREPFHPEWYRACGVVKLAAYNTIERFGNALQEKYDNEEFAFRLPDTVVLDALKEAAINMAKGMGYDHFIVPAITGGAGTSQHMNVNEILTNMALASMNKPLGAYDIIDPLEDANIFQSTNDVMPAALHVALLRRLKDLEKAINDLRHAVEEKENKYRNVLRLSYTQMQVAVPGSWGRLFSSYSDALSRDWWRVSKAFERIKVINLGGSATGTAVAVPRYYFMEVTSHLQRLTGLPVTRGENLADTTANHDDLVEAHAILKAFAVNMEKMVGDLRLLASDIVAGKTLSIPAVQMGSTVMPGKVNPVIPEYVISCARKVYANDMLITDLAAKGCLELNAYLPLMGHAFLDSLDLLIDACNSAAGKLVCGLVVDEKASVAQVYHSPSVVTALNPVIGYHSAARLAEKMNSENLDVFQANKELNLVDDDFLKEIMKPEKLLQAGFTINDLLKHKK